jgi:ankyrin repeat protein
MEAVDDHLTDIVKFLLEAGADPNIADEVIMTPFFLLFVSSLILRGLKSGLVVL